MAETVGPRGRPNIVLVVCDATGLAQLGGFGTEIANPTIAPASVGARPASPPEPRIVLCAHGGPVMGEDLPLLVGGGEIVAEVEATGIAQGVLFALGDGNGGLAVYAVAAQLSVAVVAPEAAVNITAEQSISPGRHRLGCRVAPVAHQDCMVELLVDGAVVGSATIDPGLLTAWLHGGPRLTLGHDRGLPVTGECVPPWNGTLHTVCVQGGARSAASVRNAVAVPE